MKYVVVRKLGQGSHGTVYLVRDPDQELLVMKRIQISGLGKKQLEECKREIDVLSMLTKHPNIIHYKRSFIRDGSIFIIMEYADGGDLNQLIREHRKISKYFSEDQILDWFTQICLGLKRMHDLKILHRDIKTQNIFLTSNGEVRLGDFGVSRSLQHTQDRARTLVGTPYYLSPEIIQGQPYDNHADIWSLGVVLYELLALECPFTADSMELLAKNILKGEYSPVPSMYSEGLKELIQFMLISDVSKRYNIKDVLAHPLIAERVKRYPIETIITPSSSRSVSQTMLLQKTKNACLGLDLSSAKITLLVAGGVILLTIFVVSVLVPQAADL